MKSRSTVLSGLAVILAAALVAVPTASVAHGEHPRRSGVRNGPIAYAAFVDELDNTAAWVAKADGSSARRLPLASFSYRLAWSPDGRWLVVQAWQGSAMRPVIVRPDGRDARVLNPPGLPESADVAPCVWMPSGRQLVCQVIDFTGDHSQDGLWMLDAADGRHARRLTVNPYPPGDDFGGGDLPGSVAPDGRSLVFTRARQDPANAEGQTGALFIASIPGGKLRQLTEYGLANSHDDALSGWSPDGRTIVFGSADGKVYTIRPDGKRLVETRLAGMKGFTFARSPGWSPDGRLILARVYNESAGGWGLYTFTPRGTRVTRVSAPADAEVPVWGRAPR